MTGVKIHTMLKSLKEEISAVLVGFIALFVFSLIYVLSLPVFVFRFIVAEIAKITKPELGKLVTSQGNLFTSELFLPTSPRCCIVVPIVIEGFASEKDIRDRFMTMVNTDDKQSGEKKYPEFKQYVDIWCGFAFWRNDPEFDLHNHVKSYNPESTTVIDKDVTPFVEALLNRPFQPKRSPWEVYIIHNYEDPELPRGDKTMLVMRFHHSIADGYSILYSIIEGLLQAPLSSVSLPSPKYVTRSIWSRVWFTGTFPFRLMKDMSHYFHKGLRQNPWNVPDEKKMWKQVYAKSKLVRIDDIKEIKNRLGVSFTSVLLSAISAGVNRALKPKQGEPQELMKRISCFIPLPLPGHPSALRNHVTGAQIDLPLDGNWDPVLRVKECELLLNEQKSSTIPLLLLFLSRTIGLHISSVCGELTKNRVNPIGLTNFPGGNTDIKIGFEDRKVLNVDLAVGALTGVAGVAFMAISYGTNVRFAATAEKSILKRDDVEKLLGFITDEIDGLYKIVTAAPSY